MKLLLFFFVIIFYSMEVQASAPFGSGGSSGLNKLGISSNVSRPEIWKDQLGGFATGGSIHVRTPSSNLQLLTLDPPSFDGGCGGINAYFGGFGYINSKQLEGLIKNIGSSAVSHAMMLTIKSISPQISDLLENMEAMARFMNSQNINSCQLGASIAAGAFPKNEQSQRLACQSRKMGNGGMGEHLSSYFTARYECGDADKMKATNSAEKADQPILPSEYNLVWYALDKGSSGLSSEDKEFLLSLSGTIIAKAGTKGGTIFTHKSSLALNEKMLETMIFGGEASNIKGYACDEPAKCLSPIIKSKNFKKEDTMLYKIVKIIDSLEQKILEEGTGSNPTLSADEKDLITKSSIPILKLISLNAGLKGHGVRYTVEDYAEALAFDYVIGYLDSLIDFVYQALGNLEHAQIEGDTIKNFKEEIRNIKQMLFNERVKAFDRLNTLLSVKERTRQIEKMVLLSFAEYRNGGQNE